MEEQIRHKLKLIIGEETINNGFHQPDKILKLSKALNYSITQMKFLSHFDATEQEKKEYMNQCLESINEILCN